MLHNPRFNYNFNRYFNVSMHKNLSEENDPLSSIERLINHRSIYFSGIDFKELISNLVFDAYKLRQHDKTKKRRNEYYDYYYFRYFGNYYPETD